MLALGATPLAPVSLDVHAAAETLRLRDAGIIRYLNEDARRAILDAFARGE